MTAVVPTNTVLGDLKIDEVFLRFDGPRLFSCQNRAGQSFVAVYVDEDESGEIFLYVPVSRDRMVALRSGGSRLRTAFEEPEDGVLYRVTHHPDGSTDADTVNPSAVDPEWFPAHDALLRLPTETQKPFSPEELAIESERSARPLAALRLNVLDSRTEYSLRPLGSIMELIQDAVEAFAQEVVGRPTVAGPVPQEIVSDTELAFTDVRAASFVIVVAPRLTGGKLFAPPLVTDALKRIQHLISTGSDLDVLRDEVGNLKKRALSKYRDLLEEIEDSSAGVEMYLTDARGNIDMAALSGRQVSDALRVIRMSEAEPAQVLTVEGLLIGVNVRTRVFELFDEVTEKKYSGKAIDEAREQIAGLTTMHRYRAEVLQETEYVALTGEAKVKYRLRKIEPLE